MAGRRWAKWGGPVGESRERYPRPSERRGNGQPEKSAKKPKPASISPELAARARARLEPPKAPWAPLPLAELAIVIGMIATVVAAIGNNLNGIAGGFLLTLLGTAEFSWREHRHGYRSHTTVLAASVGMALALTLWRFVGLDRTISLGLGVVVFVLCWSLLSRSFGSAVPRD